MKLLVRKQKSSVFFLLTLLMLFGTSKIGYVQANENRAPVFNEGARATRTVAENTAAGTNIGAPFTATDPDDGDTVTYSLHRKDRNAFRINPNTGQLQTRTALDYETKSTYDNLAVRATDSSGLTDAILVTINVTNVNEMPTFNIVGRSRSVAENTPAGRNIGEPFTATDPDGDVLTYGLHSGEDRHAFRIVSTTGQIQTKDALDYETKNAYTFIISVSDGNGGSLVRSVTINVTDVDEAPITPVNQRTRQVRDAILTAVGMNNGDDVTPEHLAVINQLDISNSGITSLKSGDFSGLTTLAKLDLKGNAITDIVPLEDLSTLTWLSLYDNAISDISALAAATKLTHLYLPNNAISDISVLKGLTNLTKLNLGNTTSLLGNNAISDISALAGLTKLTYLDLSNNSISDISALKDLTNLTQLHLDNNSISDISALKDLAALTYLYLGNNSISDISALKDLTNLTWLQLSNNSISDISALKGLTNLTNLELSNNSISDISALKGLTALTTLNLSSDELGNNSISDVSALEGLTALESLYLSGNPISDYGPLRRLIAAIAAIEDHPGFTLDINIPPENIPPAFTEGTSTTRTVAENTAEGTNIGAAVSATDADSDDTLSYSLGGTDENSFRIDYDSGQLQTQEALDYETKTSYSVTVTVEDSNGGSDTIDVTINVTDVNEPIIHRTQQVQDAIVAAIDGVDSADHVTEAHLAAITQLYLRYRGITSLKSDDFSGLTALTNLDLSENSISDISALKGLTNLTNLDLSENSISDISALKGLTNLTNLDLSDDRSDDLSPNSISDVSALEGLTALKSLYLSGNPISDYGPLHRLIAAIAAIEDHPGLTLDINIPPAFTEGTSTTRSVVENTAPGTNIGAPVSATDDGSYFSYSLGGTDADSFRIVGSSGQLQTQEALDYETKTSYSVTVTVEDGNGGSDTIDVTIHVTDVNEPIIHRTQQVQDAIVAAIDGVDSADHVTEAHLAAITQLYISGTGITSLKSGDFSGLATLTYLDLSYNSISNISVLSGLTKLTTLYLSENSISDISALKGLTALTTLNLSDARSDDLSPNSISDVSALEGLTALESLYLNGNPISDYGPLHRLIAAIAAIEDHPGLTLDINIPPAFTEGTSTTRSVVENTAPGTNIGAPVSATDDGSYLSYSLGGTDADTFSINSDSGQLQTRAALDYETRTSYSVTVSVSDSDDASDSITVDIEVIDFDETSITPVNQRTPQVQDAIVDAVPDVNNADHVTATHLAAITQLHLSTNNITALKSGDFNGLISLTELHLSGNSLSDISALEGLTALTWLDLSNNSLSDISALEGLTALESLYLNGNPISDYEPLRRLKAAIENAGNAIDIDIDITNNPPQFTDGDSTTRSVSENMASETNIGTAISATDADNDTLIYELSGTDVANTFTIDTYSGQLQTLAVLDYETKASYSVTVSVSDGNDGRDSIDVTINVTDVDETSITPVSQRTPQVQEAIVDAVPDVENADDVTPAHLALITRLYLHYRDITSLKSGDFSGLTALTELYLPGNSISDISELEGLTALTYLHLSGNSINDVSALEGLTALVSLQLSGNPISDYGPLRRLKAAIEDADNYIDIDIDMTNNPPQFTDGDSTTRSVSENMVPNTNVGTVISATDADNDTLDYSLGGTDADAFSINSESGQLQTTAVLDFETKASYSVTVSVYDYNNGGDIIDVTINVTDVDETSITAVNQRTPQVQEAIVDAVPDVENADDVTPTHLAVITELYLSSNNITALKSGDFSGLTSLTYLLLSSNSISDISALEGLTALTDLYLYDNSISDISALERLTALTLLDLEGNSISDVSALEGLTALTDLYLSGNPISDYGPLRSLQTAIEDAGNSIDIDIDMTNNPPVFTDGDSTTRSVAENTAAGQNIGTAVAATDADGDTLTYSLSGTDADAFDIVSASGQLQTKDTLDADTKSSYTVTVTVYDGNSGGDRITVTINVTEGGDENARAAPSVEVSPVIPEKTALLTNFPNPFNPETWIPYQLAKPAEVTLTIYDIRGVVVRELKLGHQAAGMYHSRSDAIYWDGRNAFGEKVATGVYFYTLKVSGDFTATRKLLIRK